MERQVKQEITPDRLRAARAIWGHAQPDAAREIGVNLATYCRWEQGRHTPRVKMIQRAVEHYLAEAEGQQRAD